MNVSVLTSLAELEAYTAEWSALWEEDPRATPFQRPEWLCAWWRHLGCGELFTLALRVPPGEHRAGTLVGFLPLYRYTSDEGIRYLWPLGIATSDYLDGLIAPAWDARVTDAALTKIEALHDSWDVLELSQLRRDSPLHQSRTSTLGQDGRYETEPCMVCALGPTAEEDWERLTPKLRHDLAYHERRAKRMGGLSFRLACATEARTAFDTLVRLHGARWRPRDSAGVLAEATVRAVHQEALPGLSARGLVRLYTLAIGDRPAGVFYGFADAQHVPRRRLYAYLGGFDPAFASAGPGALVMAHVRKQAVAEGIELFDLLRGAEPYKQAWGAAPCPTYGRRVRSGRRCPKVGIINRGETAS